MSETDTTQTAKTDTDRPWGERNAASGVESLYQWMMDEFTRVHARIDGLLGDHPATSETVATNEDTSGVTP